MLTARKDVIDFFEKGTFPYRGNVFKIKKEEESEEEQKETITDANELNQWVNKQETEINTEFIKLHFRIQKPSDMLKYLYRTKDKKEKINLINTINTGLKNLKEEIKEKSLKRLLDLINKNKKDKALNTNTKPNA